MKNDCVGALAYSLCGRDRKRLFAVVGVACVIGSICIESTMLSAVVGVIGASSLWAIGELFEQKKRVEKGWFPANPKRKGQYKNCKPEER